jgi:hypothetical protein
MRHLGEATVTLRPCACEPLLDVRWAVATRYEKTARSFMGVLCLATTFERNVVRRDQFGAAPSNSSVLRQVANSSVPRACALLICELGF